MNTLIQDLEMRQRKIGQAIQLLREAGLMDFQNVGGQVVSGIAAEAVPHVTKTGRTMTAEAKAAIGAKMKIRWAEKKAQGKLMNPKMIPRKPLLVRQG